MFDKKVIYEIYYISNTRLLLSEILRVFCVFLSGLLLRTKMWVSTETTNKSFDHFQELSKLRLKLWGFCRINIIVTFIQIYTSISHRITVNYEEYTNGRHPVLYISKHTAKYRNCCDFYVFNVSFYRNLYFVFKSCISIICIANWIFVYQNHLVCFKLVLCVSNLSYVNQPCAVCYKTFVLCLSKLCSVFQTVCSETNM